MSTTIGFIGAGNIARSLAGGLLSNGWSADALILADPSAEQRALAQTALGVAVYADNGDVAVRADVLILAVKPQALAAVCAALVSPVQRRQPLVLSIAAGIRTGDIARWLGGDLAVVRAMPNTPALVGAGSSGLFAAPGVSDEQRNQAESILRAVGGVVWLAHEDLMDAVTAVSGSGPAYFFLVMEALERAGIALGLDAKTARLLTLETAFGAAKMALEGGEAPAVLRARVTSKGGTTERALDALQQGGLQDLFERAVRDAAVRARELADLFGKTSP